MYKYIFEVVCTDGKYKKVEVNLHEKDNKRAFSDAFTIADNSVSICAERSSVQSIKLIDVKYFNDIEELLSESSLNKIYEWDLNKFAQLSECTHNGCRIYFVRDEKNIYVYIKYQDDIIELYFGRFKAIFSRNSRNHEIMIYDNDSRRYTYVTTVACEINISNLLLAEYKLMLNFLEYDKKSIFGITYRMMGV